MERKILERIPAAGISDDQPYREADLAIDYCEDIEPLPGEAVDQIVGLFILLMMSFDRQLIFNPGLNFFDDSLDKFPTT